MLVFVSRKESQTTSRALYPNINRPISNLIFLRRCIKFNPPIRVRLALIGLWATQSNRRLNFYSRISIFNQGLALIGVLNNRAQVTFSTTERICKELQIVLAKNYMQTKCFQRSTVGITDSSNTLITLQHRYPTCSQARHVNPQILQVALLLIVTTEMVLVAKFRPWRKKPFRNLRITSRLPCHMMINKVNYINHSSFSLTFVNLLRRSL